MKNNKFVLAVVVGSIVSFVLGWLIYGIALRSVMEQNCGIGKDLAEKVFKPMDKPDPTILGIIFVSNIFGALFLTIAAGWANARTLAGGAKVGATFGLLVALNFDLLWFAMSNLFTPAGVAIDVCAATVMNALIGAVIGMILGKGQVAA